MLTRYASVLQVRENGGGARNCYRSGAGWEAPGKTSHYSREAVLGALVQLEPHETPDPARSDAVESRFHAVRQGVWQNGMKRGFMAL